VSPELAAALAAAVETVETDLLDAWLVRALGSVEGADPALSMWPEDYRGELRRADRLSILLVLLSLLTDRQRELREQIAELLDRLARLEDEHERQGRPLPLREVRRRV
jgi:hypothetical protein